MLGCLVGGIAIEIELIGLTLVGTPGSEVYVWHLGKWWKILDLPVFSGDWLLLQCQIGA